MFRIVGSVCNFLQLIFAANVALSNGSSKRVENIFDYQWDGVGAAPGAGQKNTLVTTAVTGFKAVVCNLLLAAFNVRWVSVGVYARWLDVYTDQSTLVPGAGTFVTPGSSAGDSLPLDNSVTIRKNTGIAGKSFRGNWKFAPVSESDSNSDELIAGVVGPPATGLVAWATNLKPALLAAINDGTSNFKPVLISQKLSDLSYTPVRTIVGAPITQVLTNKALGRLKKRQERGTVAV